MVTELILGSFSDLHTDVTTVAGFLFVAFLVVALFSRMRDASASNRRINRQVRSRLENDRANEIYASRKMQQNRKQSSKVVASGLSDFHPGFNKKTGGVNGGALENLAFFQNKEQPSKTAAVKKNNQKSLKKNNGYYKKDKGYQVYLKRNSLVSKQVVKQQRFSSASKALASSRSTIKLPPHQSFNKKADGFIPSNLLSKSQKQAWSNKIRKANGL